MRLLPEMQGQIVLQFIIRNYSLSRRLRRPLHLIKTPRPRCPRNSQPITPLEYLSNLAAMYSSHPIHSSGDDRQYMQTNKFVDIYGWFASYLDQSIRDAVLQTTPTRLACSIF